MSSSLSDHGHALRPDGTLKDASEILWSYDEDESLPFPLDDAPTPSSSGSHAPATMVASVRRTTRVIRPSQRALDAAEMSSSIPASAGVKRKARADDSELDSRATRKAIEGFDDSDGSEDAPPTEVTTEPEPEPDDDDYESIKAMADADNHVRFSLILTFTGTCINFTFKAATFKIRRVERTRDVLLIFTPDKKYLHPDTGKTMDGHRCLICRLVFFFVSFYLLLTAMREGMINLSRTLHPFF
jgi:hypothetical protein